MTRADQMKQRAEKAFRAVASDLPAGAPGDSFDIENAFQLYATFAGDVERTAHALGVKPIDVLRLADEGNWSERLRAIFTLKKSTKPGDLERGLNRAMNFVQAHRMRLFIGRMLKKFSMMDENELDDFFFTVTERPDKQAGGVIVERKINTKAISDLAAAMEKCHQMSYSALNDTASERVNRGDEQERETSATEVHQALAEAMQAAQGDQSPRARLFAEQLKTGEDIRAQQEQAKKQLDTELGQ